MLGGARRTAIPQGETYEAIGDELKIGPALRADIFMSTLGGPITNAAVNEARTMGTKLY